MSGVHVPPSPNRDAPKSMDELTARIVSSIVMGLAAVVTAWLGGWVFLVFWTAAAFAIWWEWTGVVKADPRLLSIGIGAVAIAGIAVSLAADAPAVAFISAVIGAGVAAAGVQRGRAWLAVGLIYAAAAVIPAVVLRTDAALGLVAIIWLFAVVWSEDTGAYFTGRFFGGPKLAPAISPGKTWSGALGGTLAGTLAGSIVILASGIAWRPAHLVVAFVVVVAAQAGDLFESWIKRRFAVKDASNLVPGHGGLMDRLDGFIVASLVALAIGMMHGGASSPAAGLLRW